MNFKDRNYYASKVAYYLGLTATAILFDAIVLLGVLFA